MEKITVIKVGGAVVEDATSLQYLLLQFAKLEGLKVLVHGGGRSATRIATNLGIESQMMGGRRITDEKMLQVVTMVYGGLVNKNIVASLQSMDINAMGLTGADMNLILSHKRPPKHVKMENGTEQMVDFGWVGDVDRVNGKQLHNLISEGITPVVAPLSHDGKGMMLNTNADTIASQVACALSPYYDVTLTFCFEKRGVLSNAEDDTSVIPTISKADFEQMISSGIISGGMIPKLENAFDAIRNGVSQVIITHSDDIKGTEGTIIREF